MREGKSKSTQNGNETKIPSRSEVERNKRMPKVKSRSHIWDDVERGACIQICSQAFPKGLKLFDDFIQTV